MKALKVEKTNTLVKKINDYSYVRIDDHKTYVYDFSTFLKDSNAYGNNYFSKVFEWQGACREAWFYSCITKEFLKKEGILVTKKAHNEYVGETFPFQRIRCLLNISSLKKASFNIDFTFCDPDNEEIIFSKGYQQILLTDHNHKITRFPVDIIDMVGEYVK